MVGSCLALELVQLLEQHNNEWGTTELEEEMEASFVVYWTDDGKKVYSVAAVDFDTAHDNDEDWLVTLVRIDGNDEGRPCYINKTDITVGWVRDNTI